MSGGGTARCGRAPPEQLQETEGKGEKMVDCNAVMERLNREDRFCAYNGIRLTEVREGYAEAELRVTEHSMNGLGIVQGGALFTLCDLAFAGASNSYGRPCVGLGSSISYLRPGSGESLKAVARVVNAGKSICVCDVEIFNASGKIVAKSSMTGYFLDGKA